MSHESLVSGSQPLACVGQHPLETRPRQEVLNVGLDEAVAQKGLGGHDHEWLAELADELRPQSTWGDQGRSGEMRGEMRNSRTS